METDLLPAAPVLFASLVLFFYFSLVQHHGAATLATARENRFPRWLPIAVSFFKLGSVITATLASFILIFPINNLGWWAVSLLSFSLLVVLAVFDRIATLPAMRCLQWTIKWLRLVASRPNGFNGSFDASDVPVQHGSVLGPDVDELSFDSFAGLEEPVLTEEELTSLDRRDREMFRSILRLDVTTAHEIMVPRLDMVAVDTDCTLTQVAEAMVQGGHSRLPVYEQTADRIVGIVHSREILAALASPNVIPALAELLHPAFFIPETKRLDQLLEELQDRGLQMAIVVDEYGGIEGLLTMEDLLEEIVGEIEDEFSQSRDAELVHMPGGSVVVDAGISNTEIEELFDTTIESDDVDTLGGYVYQILGRIPQPGDLVTTDHLQIEVISIMGRRLRKLKVARVSNGTSC